ncbi:hypothetical protein ACJMK2_009130 [Sinanodonta woodiana]|uniref:Cytochrome b-245 light chain n=1 Tax=Sinanodonta woodiana TaxID=1069815 RepID=A0ABD3VCH9_SINWO
MSQIEWAMWANEQAVISSTVIALGGILGIAGMFENWQFGIYAIIASILIFILEWPRGKRKKGRTMERLLHRPLAVLVNHLGVFGRNYFIRFVLYLILCVPCCFILATVMGGISLFVTSIIYFIAAMKGEEWLAVGLDAETLDKKRPHSLHPPKKPPPRNNENLGDRTVDVRDVTIEEEIH